MFKSKCCNVDVIWIMTPDFLGDNPETMRVGTCHFKCENCKKDCDVILDKKLKGRKRKI